MFRHGAVSFDRPLIANTGTVRERQCTNVVDMVLENSKPHYCILPLSPKRMLVSSVSCDAPWVAVEFAGFAMPRYILGGS